MEAGDEHPGAPHREVEDERHERDPDHVQSAALTGRRRGGEFVRLALRVFDRDGSCVIETFYP